MDSRVRSMDGQKVVATGNEPVDIMLLSVKAGYLVNLLAVHSIMVM